MSKVKIFVEGLSLYVVCVGEQTNAEWRLSCGVAWRWRFLGCCGFTLAKGRVQTPIANVKCRRDESLYIPGLHE